MAIAHAHCTCEICGKEFEVTAKKRNCTEAEDFERWAVKNITVCQECEEKKFEEKQQKEIADIEVKYYDLPPLTGTHKQKAWATVIRGGYASSENKVDPRIRETILQTCTDSAWWIDHKNGATDDLKMISSIKMSPFKFDKDLFEKLKSIAMA